MQGQANHFTFAAPEKIEYGLKRYTNETKRLYGVLEGQLKKGDRKFILGDKFSLADLKTFPWVRRSDILSIDLAVEFPVIKAWIDRIEARKDVQEGLSVPA
ncbi:glutathione S-transferase [Gymnopilus junonius]|uniref:Glutathione S-transferase n=1 Tax=Gymnopilus junonius TaxID=109634 RepID=A0A9P5NIV6_GYMJU|nr:glutathione S-transferase [Gymnopilus junonius]